MAYEFTKSRVSNLFKRSDGLYFGRVMAFGKRRKKCFGRVTLEEAQEALRKWLSQVQGWNYEQGSSIPKSTTLGDCMADVESAEVAKEVSYDHRRFVRSRFKFIREQWPEFGTLQPDAVSGAEITAWVDRMRKKYSAATIRGTLLYMRMTFKYASDNKILFEDPMQKVKSPTVGPKGGNRREISVEDFDLILAEMRRVKWPACHRAADLTELLATTGGRLSEIAGKATSNLPGLKWKDVDFKNKQITIFGAKYRRGKVSVPAPRTIPFHPRLQALLERLKEKSHTQEALVSPASTAKKSLFGAAKRLHQAGKIKFDKLSHHDLRHMFTTWLVESGVDVPTIADLLGHKDGGALLLKTYRHLRTEHLHNAMKKLK